ncbi:kat8 regulatory nsl complex subunit 1-like protein [Plakobranchus ocellatus]|uniref:Kat8 regulatory nsl complex subunit 1-like protein n=1 Tax=Plakobranchus ocellatus TaxID=259542 RepID=A0AAV4CJV4_9GAST|nr:kat8 regulatory nsl complex subunit 1-like protein [Plakobranchus ocellatus]
MAPALTEAASARMRLQDTPDSERTITKSDFKPFHGKRTFNISRTLPSPNNDLKALGGRKRSKGEGRVTHLSLADSERDILQLNHPKVSTITCKVGNLQSFTARVCSNADKPSLSPPNSKISHLDTSLINIESKNIKSTESTFHVSEDFQESSAVLEINNSFLKDFKIMNQPDLGINKESNNSAAREYTKFEDLPLVQNFNHVRGDSEPRMVNGNGDIDKKGSGSRKDCDERGDAQPRKTPNLVNKRSVHFTEVEKPQAEPKDILDKMGVLCTGKEALSRTSNQILSLASSSEFQSLEELDSKSRDETRKECARKQAYLERKVETLLRRLKRMRGKVVETHAREQLRQFVNFQHRSLQQVAKVIRSEAPGPAELKEHFLSNEEVKSMSTTELVKLVKTYQPLASAQHRSLQSHMSDHRGSSGLPKLGGPCKNAHPVLVMDSGLRAQCSEVSERLCQRVLTVSGELDSDATASSSGGESGDEETASAITDASAPKPKLVSDLPPLLKRAEWRWASDRAGIVSRWTWLQAQVSDLEYRIRQQSQVHRQLRASKGGVVLGDPPSTSDILRHVHGMIPPTAQGKAINSDSQAKGEGGKLSLEDDRESFEVSPCNIQAVMSNIDKQASRLTQSLGNCLSPASSTTSASASVVGSPRLASSTSSPGRSPAQASIRDSSPTGHSEYFNHGNTSSCSPSVPTELSLASRTSDLLHTPPELQRQQKGSLSSLSSSSLLPSSSSHLDTTCQSARCRPLRSYRKRRILRTIGLHRQSHKAARLSDVRCRCSPPANACPMCGGRQNNTLPMDPETMALRERIALIDASFHPILSFPEDVALPIHCEGLLKSGLWQDKPLAKRSRGSHRHHQYRGSLILPGDYNLNNHKRHQNNNISNSSNNNNHHHQGKVLGLVSADTGLRQVSKKKTKKSVITTNGGHQNKRNTSTSVSTAASVIKNFSEKIKNKYESKVKSKSAAKKGKTVLPRANKMNRKSSKVAKATLKKKKQIEDEEEDLEALYLEQELEDIDEDCGGGSGGLSASASQSSLKDMGHQHHRSHRRRFDNSYDINNIVIPLSMATSVPVEQPQYKEIVTPKWREVPVSELPFVLAEARESLTSKLEKTNGVAKPVDQLQPVELATVPEDKPVENENEDEEEEDLSDDKFALRHLKLELEEKKRFRNFVQYPPLRRSRARSDVSLSSLDTKYIDRGESFPSEENSLSSRPTTPVLMKSLPPISQMTGRGPSLEESLAALQQQVQVQRPRTLSVSTPARRETRTSSQTGQDGSELQQDSRAGAVESWPRRIFPLPKEEYEAMLEASDPGCRPAHQHETRFARANASKPVVKIIDLTEREIAVNTGRPPETALDSVHSVVDSVALSPQSVSASASVSSAADDDMADPEWAGGTDVGGLSSNSTTSGSSCKRGRSRPILDDPNDPEWLGSDTPRKNKNKR